MGWTRKMTDVLVGSSIAKKKLCKTGMNLVGGPSFFPGSRN